MRDNSPYWGCKETCHGYRLYNVNSKYGASIDALKKTF
jgi:hypothetical protein